MSKRADEMRKNFKAGDDIRDAGLKTPENVVRFDDIQYGPEADWQKLDVYRPKGSHEIKLPVIVSVHGGGWSYGDKERYQYYCMSLVQYGFAVVNFTYRLAPEFRFPAMLEDTNTVFKWVLDNADKYAFDTEHIFGVGDSAGANILGLYCGFCTDPEYAAKYDFKAPEGFVPTAVALNCGKYTFEEVVPGKDEMMVDLFGDDNTQDDLDLLDVTKYVTSAFPPSFVMTGTGDFLKDQALVMASCLAEHNVPFLYRLYGDDKNRLGHVFHCNMKLADGAAANRDECDFFKPFCFK